MHSTVMWCGCVGAVHSDAVGGEERGGASIYLGINLIIYRLSPPLIVINMLTNLILTQTCQNDNNRNT